MSNLTLGAIDFKYLLLEFYKTLNIKEEELAVILMVDHYLAQKEKFITADLLAIKMNYKTSEIDKILVNLVTKKFIEYDTSSANIKTTLKPLQKKLYKQFQIHMAKVNETKQDETKSNSFKNIFEIFEKQFARVLSPVEISLLHSWIDNGHSDEEILSALNEAFNHNKKSFKSIDKILLKYQAKKDIEAEGYSGVNDKWNKSIEETIKIAQYKWVKNND